MTVNRQACVALLMAAAACGGDTGSGSDGGSGSDANTGVDTAPLADALPAAGALFVWQAPGGFVGTGPALAIATDGAIHLWDATFGFNPDQPPMDFDRTVNVSQGQLGDLYSLWGNTDTTNLPHQTGTQAECGPLLYVRACGACTPVQIIYNNAAQLEPELEPVWTWFDTVLANEPAATGPRDFCRL